MLYLTDGFDEASVCEGETEFLNPQIHLTDFNCSEKIICYAFRVSVAKMVPRVIQVAVDMYNDVLNNYSGKMY